MEKAASERLIIYSGGAKGIDSTSEKAAVESGSAAVSFIADSLLSKIRKKIFWIQLLIKSSSFSRM